MPRPIVIALSAVIAALALALPAAASAHTYCVNKPLCLSGTNAADPQIALTLAQLNSGPDTVLIGAKADPYVGPFSYSGPDPVTIVGVGTGPGETTLAAPAGPQPTLTLKGAQSSVSNLRIEVVTGPGIGLDLEGTATGVRVEENENKMEIGPALGVFLAGGALFEEGSVAMIGGEGVASADAGNYSFVRDSTIRSREGDGIWTLGKLSVTRSTVESAQVGIDVTGLKADADLGDTVVRAADGLALRASNGGTVMARHLTLLDDGDAKRGIDVVAGSPGTGGPTSLTLISSIVSGFPIALYREGGDATLPANATLRYSAWDSGLDETGTGTLALGPGNLPATTPVFVQRLSAPPTIQSNLRLLAPSPLIDAADPGAPPIDHDGTPREQDGDGDGVGRSDIGAFEYVPHAPTAATIAPIGGAVAGTPVQFAAAGADDPDPREKDKLVYSWDFGDGGTATGATATHTFDAAGARTVTLTVTDPSRLTATTTTTVDVAPSPGPVDATPGSGGSPGSRPVAKDRLAPRLSGVSLSSRRLQLGRHLPKLVAGSRGSQIRFTLSEPAKVTLRFTPVKKAGSKGGPLTLVVDGKAGPNRLSFAGRISPGKQLGLGAHRLALTAVDAAGNRSQDRLVRLLELIP